VKDCRFANNCVEYSHMISYAYILSMKEGRCQSWLWTVLVVVYLGTITGGLILCGYQILILKEEVRQLQLSANLVKEVS